MTHYKRPWRSVLFVLAIICVATAFLFVGAIQTIEPRFWSELRMYGMEMDRVGWVLACAACAVVIGAVWWLRRPSVAEGTGFEVSRAADPRRTHSLQP